MSKNARYAWRLSLGGLLLGYWPTCWPSRWASSTARSRSAMAWNTRGGSPGTPPASRISARRTWRTAISCSATATPGIACGRWSSPAAMPAGRSPKCSAPRPCRWTGSPAPGLPTHRRGHLRQPGRAHARPAAALQRRDQRLSGAGPGGAAAGIQPGEPRTAGALGAGGQPVPAPALFLDPERQPGHAVAAPGAGRAPGPGADQRGVRPYPGERPPATRDYASLYRSCAARRTPASCWGNCPVPTSGHRFEQLGGLRQPAPPASRCWPTIRTCA